jgi:hypothetical protein
MVFGIDASVDPAYLNPSLLSKAVNRQFRGGFNQTRPPFVHKPFVFSDPADEPIVRFGNVQGACYYKKTRAGRIDSLVASIAGTIFRFTLVNESFVVDRIFKGNNAQCLHTWFCQAQDWLYIQNGIDKPIFWEGVIPSTARYSKFPDVKEMPIGTLMVYAFGRVFVSDAFDQIAASDIIYGTGFTVTSNTQNFTENTYWNEGGSFGMPTNLGHITGMTVTPAQRQGDTWGQGVVLVFGEDGAQAIDASRDRTTWKDAQVQSITLLGSGCIAPGSVCNVNNQTIFRSDDGLAVYQNLLASQNNSLSFGKFSQSTNIWIDEETPDLRRFNSTIVINNRVLSTVSPVVAGAADSTFGDHRFHRGVICLDLDRSAEKLNGQAMAWDGLWTGIRPTVLVNGRFDGVKRGFAFSFDADGENRIYEIGGSGINDQVNATEVKTKWFFISKRWDWSSSQASNGFELKKLCGGELHISGVRDRITISADYRSDNRPDWNTLMGDTLFGPQLTDFNFSEPRFKRYKFLTPSDHCKQGESRPAAHGFTHQVMVSGAGGVRVDRLRIAAAPGTNDPNIPTGDDPLKVDDPNFQLGLDGRIEDDYGYLIVPKP